MNSPHLSARHPSWLPSLLGLFIAVGPAATDMYLPAFPAVEATFHSAPGSAQMTLASWFGGIAIGQLTQGSLSDRFGRRVPLMAGFVVFTLATIGCAMAPDIIWLSVFRAIAAFGASAGMVIARAVVRDLADGQNAAIMMSRLVLVMGLAPILAPSVGGLILIFAHWRFIFWLLAVYGTSCILTAWLVLPETLPDERRLRLSLAGLLARYVSILRERVFLVHALMGCGTTFCMFAYLSGSSPVFEEGFGLSPSRFGLIFGACAMSLVAASQLNARLLPRYGLPFMLRTVVRISLAGNLVLLFFAFSGHPNIWTIIVPLLVIIGCQGCNNANTNAGALMRHAGHAGSAAAVMGTFQFGIGAMSGVIVGLLTDGTPRPMAAMMCLGMVLAVTADLFRARVARA